MTTDTFDLWEKLLSLVRLRMPGKRAGRGMAPVSWPETEWYSRIDSGEILEWVLQVKKRGDNAGIFFHLDHEGVA
jgi:nicotinic acid phosphoribosyltransferase